MENIFKKGTGDFNCKLGRQNDIGPLIVILPIAIFLIPLVLVFVIILIAKKKRA